jgi:hypothetical protein
VSTTARHSPIMGALTQPMEAILTNEELAARLDQVEEKLELLMETIGDLADHVTSVAESDSAHTSAVERVIHESAAITQYLWMFGEYMEKVSKTIPPGSLESIYDTITDNLDPQVRDGAVRVVTGLGYWTKTGA